MKKAIVYIMFLILPSSVYSQYNISGGVGDPYLLLKDDTESIEVYLLNGMAGAEISFTYSGSELPQWYKYQINASSSEPISAEVSGSISTITDIEEGWGYYVGTEFGPLNQNVIWVIDYNKHKPNIYSMTYEINDNTRCSKVTLLPDIEADPFLYRTYKGIEKYINRTFFIQYNDLEWNEDIRHYEEKLISNEITNGREFELNAPLINTVFSLSGDVAAKHFGQEQTVTTAEYNAIALEVETFAYYMDDEGEEQPLNEDDNYQAPLVIRFEAYTNNPPGIMYIWRIFKINPDTGERESSETFRYESATCEPNFTESGTYEVILEIDDVSGSGICSYVSDPYEYRIFFEESLLKLPNAFSPGSSFGSNDVYKVYYKSLVSFKASIFNRWGNLLYTWTDPDQGWDGRVNGKYVPTGVYFIVVEAKGADGKKYKKNSDINVLRSRN